MEKHTILKLTVLRKSCKKGLTASSSSTHMAIEQ